MGLVVPNIAKAQYCLSYNEAEFLSLPTPPYNGYIASALWNVNNDNLTFDKHDEAGAIIYPNHYYEGSSLVTCNYRYEYYRNDRMQTGTGVASYVITFKSNKATLSKNEITLLVGKTEKLTYTLERSYGSAYGSPKMTWESSRESVAEVDKNGKVKAISPGTTTITFDPVVGPPVYCEVTVVSNPPTAISVNPERLLLQEGKKGSFTYQLTPEDAYTQITWESSNESVAKVSSDGIVSAVSQGTAQITATTSNGLSAYGTVEVTPLPQHVSLTSSQQTTIGYLFKLEPTLTPSNATTIFKWETADAEIATVDNMGKVRGKTAGTTTITVTTENGKTATCTVTVKSPSEGMDYRNAEVRLKTIKSLINKSLSNL